MSEAVSKYFKKAFFIREFENFLIELFKKGELNGTVHTCVGQELTPVVLAAFLKSGDRLFSNHRGHGHFLAFDGDTKALLAEMLGLQTGVSRGIGGSQHLMNDGFISNGIQGGMTPIAAGYAYANKMKGNDNVSVVFIGDGTLGSGVLYESMNLAAHFEAPIVYVLENNQLPPCCGKYGLIRIKYRLIILEYPISKITKTILEAMSSTGIPNCKNFDGMFIKFAATK